MAEKTPVRKIKTDDLIAEVKRQLGEHLLSTIYRDRIRTIRTRRYELNAPARSVEASVMHTLLGIELKIGRRRLLCPDPATARYLLIFARLGLPDVAVPYDITQISRLADDLESSWYRMLMLAEHLCAGYKSGFHARVRSGLIRDQRKEVIALGAGPAIPEFNQNTKQRRTKIQ